MQGQVREEQLLVSLPAEFFTGEIPKGRTLKQQEQEWTWPFTGPLRFREGGGSSAPSIFLAWYPLDLCCMMSI